MQTNKYGMKGTCNRITKDKAHRVKKRNTTHYLIVRYCLLLATGMGLTSTRDAYPIRKLGQRARCRSGSRLGRTLLGNNETIITAIAIKFDT